MHIYSVTYGATLSDIQDDDWKAALVVVKTPIHWHVIESLVGWACKLTGHRFCMSGLVSYVARLVRDHQDDFYVTASDEEVREFAEWRGWGPPPFVDEGEVA